MRITSHPTNAALLCIALGTLGGLGAAALTTTPLGAPNAGWADGSYQRVYEARFERRLPTFSLASETWAALRLGLLGETAEGAVMGRDGWLFTAEEFQAPDASHDLAEALARTAEALDAVGATLLPVIVPDKARMLSHHLPHARSPAFAARYDAALDAARRAGVTALDLRPVLGAVQQPFMRTDTHWSPAGAAAVADVVARAVVADGLALTPTKVTHRAGQPRPFDGDLIAFAETGRWRGFVGPAPETIATFATDLEAGGDLFGAQAVDVLLVGTSFSARPDFHFEGFLKAALKTDLINLAVEGQGPFGPMDAALAALADLPAPPRLVIWEIPERYLPLAPLP